MSATRRGQRQTTWRVRGGAEVKAELHMVGEAAQTVRSQLTPDCVHAAKGDTLALLPAGPLPQTSWPPLSRPLLRARPRLPRRSNVPTPLSSVQMSQTGEPVVWYARSVRERATAWQSKGADFSRVPAWEILQERRLPPHSSCLLQVSRLSLLQAQWLRCASS